PQRVASLRPAPPPAYLSPVTSRPYLAVDHYDGAQFVGWQRQRDGRTVQAEFEAVLARLMGRRTTATGAGRTDTGVHALGQGVGFLAGERWAADADGLRRALNALLPRDVWVERVHPMRAGFHARKSAVARRYRYLIGTDDTAHSPFRRPYEWAFARGRDGGHRPGPAPPRGPSPSAGRDRQPGGQPARAAPGSVSGGGALPRAPLRRGRAMKFFLDTASLKDISWATQAGLIDGITTNPSLLSKQAGDLDPRDVLKEICSLVEGPVSAEVVAVDTEGMVKEGKELAKIADNIVVKIPMIEAGMIAVRRLAAEGIRAPHPLSGPGRGQCLADWSKRVARAKAAV